MWKLIDSRCCRISSVILIVFDLGSNLYNTLMTIELFYLIALTDEEVNNLKVCYKL